MNWVMVGVSPIMFSLLFCLQVMSPEPDLVLFPICSPPKAELSADENESAPLNPAGEGVARLAS